MEPDSEKAGNLRDEMEEIWNFLSQEEMKMVDQAILFGVGVREEKSWDREEI